MSRAWSVYTAFLLLLVAMALFAWLSRDPDAAFFDRAERWAVIGGWIGDLRVLYRPPVGDPASDTDNDIGSVTGSADRGAGSSASSPDEERAWIGIGAALRDSPTPGARRLELTRGLRSYQIVARRGRWLAVALPDGLTAWYDPEAPRDRTPPLGMGTKPVLPVPAMAADPARLAMARDALDRQPRELELAGYRWLTDVRDTEALAALGRRLETVEQVYGQRYGVSALGTPAETVVVFEREEGYRTLENQVLKFDGEQTLGHASRGVVALFLGDRQLEDTAATLFHEIGHLLNRRALGPALPLWLEEGLAEDLAQFAMPAALVPAASPYLGQRRDLGEGTVLFTGNLGALAALRTELAAGTLPSLESLTGSVDRFAPPEANALLYSHAGFWLRSLNERRPAGLRQFLRSVAAGGPATGEQLRQHLGVEWSELDLEFAEFLRAEAMVAGLPATTYDPVPQTVP